MGLAESNLGTYRGGGADCAIFIIEDIPVWLFPGFAGLLQFDCFVPEVLGDRVPVMVHRRPAVLHWSADILSQPGTTIAIREAVPE